MSLQLSLAVGDYDRTRAIFDGRAPVEGCDITAVALEPEELFTVPSSSRSSISPRFP